MSARRCKTHVYLTLQQRFDILQKLEDGFPLSQLANKYNVTDLTIRRIKSNSVQIRQQLQISEAHDQKKLRTPLFEELDARLHSWYLQRRRIGDIVTDVQLQEKARELNEEVDGPSSFSASRGWVWRFKRRHGIRLQKLHGESICANTKVAEEFSRSFLQRLEEENIKLQNVYNMDETSLMWKVIPKKSLVYSGEIRVPGNKIKKDRVTVWLCTNATGTHKLPPIFINKHERLRVLKHCSNSLPVIFKAQKNAFMDQSMFADWLKNHFKPAVREQQLERGIRGKVLLLLHNHEAHVLPSKEQGENDNIEIVYFPANTVSTLQPMGQGIIETMKRSYRQRMLMRILEFPGGLKEFYKKYDIKDCINILNDAWIDVTQITICKSWEKILANEATTEQEVHRDQEENSSIITDIPGTMKTITKEAVLQQEIEKSLTSYSEAEDDLDLEIQNHRDNEQPYLEQRPHLDEVEINRMFKNLVLWSQKQPRFIKIQVQALQDFYEYTRR